MNSQQARDIVSRTFTQSFDKARFREFIANVLNHFKESNAKQWSPANVKSAFVSYVSRFERLGSYTTTSGESLDVLVVYITDESKLERARTAMRNFVADYLSRERKDAALVAFVSPSERLWRFSYVRMEYSAIRRDNGRIDITELITPARRFSYIVGAGESCHTAQARFLALLREVNIDPSLEAIEEAFSVEAVTREFFNKYFELFSAINDSLENLMASNKAIRDELQSKRVRAVDFAKKLLGQIVFLYFLQKKGWVGVKKGEAWGSGPHDFLRRLATGGYGEYKNLFNDVLEPLFYDVLATDRGHDAWCEWLGCRMPFLNGGLFEPLGGYDWRKLDVLLPNELFSNAEPFDGELTGTGIFDIFDRYNFTVNESEPLEKEVAIDPEMLGKVFENLIEDNRRRGTGAYYTPRDIVHYMCRESLINYLEAAALRDGISIPRDDLETFVQMGEQISHYEAVDARYAVKMPPGIERHARSLDAFLAGITVCDPAVGSGAFPVGMMTEIIRARGALTPYFDDVSDRTPYNFKWHAIHNSLYGVDIDAGAVEIAKLRLWLSLIVDEENTKQIKPLPNLDFKVVVGNSLIGFPFRSQGLEDIERLKNKFFEETDHGKKALLKLEIDEALAQCYARSKKSLGYEVDFDFGVVFSEVFRTSGGFHIVISNPPYITSEAMAKTDGDLRDLVRQSYTMTRGNWDIYIAFFEKGFEILGDGGGLTFITPDKWMSKPFGDELRKHKTAHIYSILKAGRSVFESVNVDAVVSIFTRSQQSMLRIYDYIDQQIELKRIIPKSMLKVPYTYDWLFSDFVELLTEIEGQPYLLSRHGICENSCATNDAYKLKPFIHEEVAAEKARPGSYLKIINTGTIGKFVSKWGQREMVYLGKRFMRPTINKSRFQAHFPNTYGIKSLKPKIIIKGLNLLDACLDEHGQIVPGVTTLIMTSRNQPDLKLLLGIVNSTLAFFYIKQKYIASSYNEGTTFTKDMINNLPLPDLPESAKSGIVEVVDQILAIRKRDPEASTLELERKIDRLLYNAYRLSATDVATIETNVNNRGRAKGSRAALVNAE